MNEKFEFITSSRFWALVIGAVSIYLQAKGIIGDPEMMLIATITAGFVTVRTVDRMGDKKVEAAESASGVTTVTMPSTVSQVTATTEKGSD